MNKLLTLFVCAAVLLACEKPDRHPIVGVFEGDSEDTLGPVISELRFDDDGTFVWRRTFVGLKERMEQRNPDIDWGDIGLEISGEYTITDDEIRLSPEKSRQTYGSDDFGAPMLPLFEEGEMYLHRYYFEGKDLILIGDAGQEIYFTRK